MHKYSCEFGLGVYCSYKTILPAEELNNLIRKDNRYHIYAILATHKISIKNAKKYKEGISFELIKHLGENDESIRFEKVDILGLGFDYHKADIELKYPYSKINIKFDKKYLKEFYDENIKGKYSIHKSEVLKFKNVTIDSSRLFYMMTYNENRKNEMEVLYVGQAYGGNGQRSAIDRLKSHEKLQKILAECNIEYPHKRIYILLMEMETQLFSAFNGIEKEFEVSEEKSEEHLNEVMSNLPIEKQVINITEAAIINYFKPKYNNKFVNNFPSVNHGSYRQYYDLDYNKIIIELDMTFNNMPYLELYTKCNRLTNPFESIQYILSNDPNRKDMYDIFIEEKNK